MYFLIEFCSLGAQDTVKLSTIYEGKALLFALIGYRAICPINVGDGMAAPARIGQFFH